MLYGRGAVRDRARHICVVLFRKETSDDYFSESVDFFGRNSKLGRPRPPPFLLTYAFIAVREEGVENL